MLFTTVFHAEKCFFYLSCIFVLLCQDVQGVNAFYIGPLAKDRHSVSILMTNYGVAAVTLFWLGRPSVCLIL
jgi:ammonia channel protein AmtB